MATRRRTLTAVRLALRSYFRGGEGGDPVNTTATLDRPGISGGQKRAKPTLRRFLQLEARLDDLEAQQSNFSEREIEEFRRRIKTPTEDEIEFNLDKDKLTAWAAAMDEQIRAHLAGNKDSAVGREIDAIVDEIRDICSQLPIPGFFMDDYETPFSEEFIERLRRRWRSCVDWCRYSHERRQILVHFAQMSADRSAQTSKKRIASRQQKIFDRNIELALEFERRRGRFRGSDSALMKKVGAKNPLLKPDGRPLLLKRSASITAIEDGLKRLGRPIGPRRRG